MSSFPRTPTIALLLLAAGVGFSSVRVSADEAVLLERKWRTDHRARYRLSWETSASQRVKGATPFAGRVRGAIVFSEKVRAVSTDGVGTVERVYESVAYETAGPLLELSFDSGKPVAATDHVFARMMAKLPGSVVVAGVDRRGAIVSAPDLGPAVARAAAAESADPWRSLGEGLLRGAFLPEHSSDPLLVAFQALPTGPGAPGETWRHTAVVPCPVEGSGKTVSLKLDATFRFRRMKTVAATRCARIEAEAEVTVPPPAERAADGLFHLFRVKDAKADAHLDLDPEAGVLVDETATLEVTLEEFTTASPDLTDLEAAFAGARKLGTYEIREKLRLERLKSR